MLIILAARNAALSGYLSQIGMLAKDAELGSHSLLGSLGFFHGACDSASELETAQKAATCPTNSQGRFFLPSAWTMTAKLKPLYGLVHKIASHYPEGLKCYLQGLMEYESSRCIKSPSVGPLHASIAVKFLAIAARNL